MKKNILSVTARYLVAFVLLISLLVNLSWSQENSEQPVASVKEKSPRTAFLLSVLGTTFPFALSLASNRIQSNVFTFAVGSAFLVGPSLGFFYGGLIGRGLVGVGLRALGGGLMVIGIVNLVEAIFGEENSAESVTIPFYAGAGIVIGSIIWDLATVKSAVRKRNEKIRERTLALSPFLNPRTRTVGLSLQISF